LALRRVEWRLFGFGMMQFLSILARRAGEHPIGARHKPVWPIFNERRNTL